MIWELLILKFPHFFSLVCPFSLASVIIVADVGEGFCCTTHFYCMTHIMDDLCIEVNQNKEITIYYDLERYLLYTSLAYMGNYWRDIRTCS